MLEIKHLSFSFDGRQILQDITANYGAAQMHGLAGHNFEWNESRISATIMNFSQVHYGC